MNLKSFFAYEVRVKCDKICLTDVWAVGRRRGVVDGKVSPKFWLRPPYTRVTRGKEVREAGLGWTHVETVSKDMKSNYVRVCECVRGRDGGTWVHWRIGAKYMEYLLPGVTDDLVFADDEEMNIRKLLRRLSYVHS